MAKVMGHQTDNPHFLIVTFPAQGHLSPALEFAKRLLTLGVKVTLATSISAYHKMSKSCKIPGCFNLAVFSNGFDDDGGYKSQVERRNRGIQSLKDTILSTSQNGTPVTCLVCTILLPWAAEVARGFNISSALLWIQPASVLRFYYYYFNGYDKVVGDNCNDPSWSFELPGLPILKICDLPSFCLPSDTYNSMLPLFKEVVDMLVSEDKPKLLVNTFDALEEEALKEIDGKLNLTAVGPLIPCDKSFVGDLFETNSERGYMEWMNTKPKGSIVYISFGSIIMLSKKQKEEMAQGLLASGRPFLWVIRDKDGDLKGQKVEDEEELNYMEELKQLGLIVPWCSQVEVLSHPSLGCFVTHCGWNSTLESIVSGVPVVAFPQWMDQSTNAKLVEDVWGTGVRVVSANEHDGVVEGDEIRRCIELVMGHHERGETMRKNANKWKHLAREAMEETASSYMNLKAFVEQVNGSSSIQEKVVIFE